MQVSINPLASIMAETTVPHSCTFKMIQSSGQRNSYENLENTSNMSYLNNRLYCQSPNISP